MERFELLQAYQGSRRWRAAELVVQLSEGHTLRYMLEEDRPPELIEQRLTQEFVSRFVPGPKYAAMATSGFLDHILLAQTFGRDWKAGKQRVIRRSNEKYMVRDLTGTFDKRYPQRKLTLAVAALSQSPVPNWEKLEPDADIEMRFEMNFGLPVSEPSQLLVSPERPNCCGFPIKPQCY